MIMKGNRCLPGHKGWGRDETMKVWFCVYVKVSQAVLFNMCSLLYVKYLLLLLQLFRNVSA